MYYDVCCDRVLHDPLFIYGLTPVCGSDVVVGFIRFRDSINQLRGIKMKLTNNQFLKVNNVAVYGINESLIASGYPMAVNATMEMSDKERLLKRGAHLGKAIPGSGHDCFLKGITVQFDLTAPEYFWRQLDRYHFIDYVSSQSKMHRILKLDLDKQCNPYVTKDALYNLQKLIDIYNNMDEMVQIRLRHGDLTTMNKKDMFQMIVANIPSGLRLTARMTTNYLQLKTIREQRKAHKLAEWHIFCQWVDTLPLFKELTERKPKPKPYATCNQCGSDMIWQSDFSFEDYGYEGDGLVAVAICSKCGTYAEYRTETTVSLDEIKAKQGK